MNTEKMYVMILGTYGLVVEHSFAPHLGSLNFATVSVSKFPVFGKSKNPWKSIIAC